MDKETIRSFLQWLDGASLEEIERRKQDFLKTRSMVTSSEAKSDIRLGLRLIDEELVARLDLGRTHVL
jgi:hypothetical protein